MTTLNRKTYEGPLSQEEINQIAAQNFEDLELMGIHSEDDIPDESAETEEADDPPPDEDEADEEPEPSKDAGSAPEPKPGG